MSDDTPQDPAPKKKGGKGKLIIIIVGALVLIGGGAAAGMYAAGIGIGGHAEAPEDPNEPKLVQKDGSEISVSKAKAAGQVKARDGELRPDPAKFKASYYTIEENFTSNLRDTDGFVQMQVGISTFYDKRVLDRMKDHEMAIRSAILMTLADQDAFVLTTPEGKDQLKTALRKAINATLVQKEGFGGVDDVYFTNFIIQ